MERWFAKHPHHILRNRPARNLPSNEGDLLPARWFGPGAIPPRRGTELPGNFAATAASGNHEPLEWWRAFNDPVLDEVVGSVLESNFDIAESVARVRQARVRASRTSSISGVGSGTRRSRAGADLLASESDAHAARIGVLTETIAAFRWRHLRHRRPDRGPAGRRRRDRDRDRRHGRSDSGGSGPLRAERTGSPLPIVVM